VGFFVSRYLENLMFVLDIETTGSRETAIVLSIGIVHVSNDALDTIHTYEDLMNE
jgi:DNA polymerase III epsilon subunit-like protein